MAVGAPEIALLRWQSSQLDTLRKQHYQYRDNGTCHSHTHARNVCGAYDKRATLSVRNRASGRGPVRASNSAALGNQLINALGKKTTRHNP